jgi:hypothetical protein
MIFGPKRPISICYTLYLHTFADGVEQMKPHNGSPIFTTKTHSA